MLIKQSLLDSTFDSMDLAVGVFGSAAASAFFLLVPQEDYELETEAGWRLAATKSHDGHRQLSGVELIMG